ncbi:hypothetical protein [Phocaeicola sp.]
MEEKDKLIASLRQQLRQALSKCSALEQENALLAYELDKQKEQNKTVKIG